MKTIKILGFHDKFAVNRREKLDAAARALSDRTGFSIVPTDDGFRVAGQWRGKFLSEDQFAERIVRDLQLRAGLLFDATIEG